MIAIILAIQNDDERHAIGCLFQAYFPRMKALAFDILKNEHDAEDAAMNAVAYMCEHPKRFLDYTSDKTVSLVFLCVKHHAIDLYRRNQLHRDTFISMEEENLDAVLSSTELLPGELAVSEENRRMLVRAIRALDAMYQVPIVLKYTHRMRNIEIAEFLHIPPNMVNGRLHRAKKKLAETMQEMGYTP